MTLFAAPDHRNPPPVWFDDEIDDDADDDFDDDDDDNDNDNDEDDADDDGDEEEPETWQVHGWFAVKTVRASLDFNQVTCLDWRPLPSSSELDPFGGLRVCLPAQSLGS